MYHRKTSERSCGLAEVDILLHQRKQRRAFNIYSLAGNIIAARQYCSSSNHQGEYVTYLADIRGSVTSIVDGNMNFIQGYRYTDYGVTTRIGEGAFISRMYCYHIKYRAIIRLGIVNFRMNAQEQR